MIYQNIPKLISVAISPDENASLNVLMSKVELTKLSSGLEFSSTSSKIVNRNAVKKIMSTCKKLCKRNTITSINRYGTDHCYQHLVLSPPSQKDQYLVVQWQNMVFPKMSFMNLLSRILMNESILMRFPLKNIYISSYGYLISIVNIFSDDIISVTTSFPEQISLEWSKFTSVALKKRILEKQFGKELSDSAFSVFGEKCIITFVFREKIDPELFLSLYSIVLEIESDIDVDLISSYVIEMSEKISFKIIQLFKETFTNMSKYSWMKF